MKWLKRVGLVLSGLLVLALAALIVGPKILPLKRILEERVQSDLGRPAHVERVSMSVIGGLSIHVSGLLVEELPEFGTRPFLKVERLDLQARLLPLLLSRVIVEELAIDGIELSVVQSENGILNLHSLPKRNPVALSDNPGHLRHSALGLKQVVLQEGHVTGSSVFLENLATGHASEIPLESFRIQSTATPREARLHWNVRLPGVVLEADGELLNVATVPTIREARCSLRVSLDEVAQRLAPVMPQLEGRGTLDILLTATGPRDRLQTQALISAEHLFLSAARFPDGKTVTVDDLIIRSDLTIDLPGEVAEVHTLDLVSHSAGIRSSIQGRFGPIHASETLHGVFSLEADLGEAYASLGPLFPSRAPLKGELTAQGRLDLDLGKKLSSSITVNVHHFELDARPGFGLFQDPYLRMTFEGTLDGKARQIETLDLDVSSSSLKMNARGRITADDTEFAVNAKAELEMLQALISTIADFPQDLKLSGTAVLTARLNGSPLERRMDARLALADTGIHYSNRLDKPRGVPAEIRFSGADRPSLRSGETSVALGPLRFRAKGSVSPEGLAHLHAEMDPVELARLAGLFPEFAAVSPSGVLSFDMGADEFPLPKRASAAPHIPVLTGHVSFRNLTLSLGPKDAPLRPMLTGSLVADPREIRLDNVILTLMDQNIRIAGAAEEYTQWPAGGVRLSLTADILDLDTLSALWSYSFPPDTSPPSSERIPETNGEPSLAEAAAGLLADFEASVERLLYRGYEARNVRLQTRLENSRLNLEEASCRTLGGSLEMHGRVDLSIPSPETRIHVDAGEIRITPEIFAQFKKDIPFFALPIDSLSGTFHLVSDTVMAGTNAQDMLKTLTGAARIRAPEGVKVDFGVFGEAFPLRGMFRGNVMQQLAAGEFSRMEGTLEMVRGTADFDLLFLLGDDALSARLVGFTKLPDRLVEARLRLGGLLIGRDLRRILGEDGTLPVKIEGSLDDLRPSFELRGTPVERMLRELSGSRDPHGS